MKVNYLKAHVHQIELMKTNKLYMSAKRKVCLREINQTLRKVNTLVQKMNNKALGRPTKVDASGCHTMEILK